MRKLGIAAGCLIVIAVLVVLDLRPKHTAGPCTLVNGPAMLPDIPEASGLAVSRRNKGVIWSHNDSGNQAVLFALDPSGMLLGRIPLSIHMRDWEDISAGHCGSGECLYLGDIGDNRFGRRQIQIYRVPEPSPGDTSTETPEVFTGTYDDGPQNAEAMFVIGSDIFLITRDRTGRVYRSFPSFPNREELTFQRIAQLGLEVVTDAEATPDEKSVVVRTSHEVLLYKTENLLRGETVPYLRIPIDGLREAQGEGVALDEKGMLYLASEGRPWNRDGRLLTLRCMLSL